MTQYLLSFMDFKEELPVVWHQLLLTFIRQYNSAIDEMSKNSLAQLAKKHSHKLITPEILKELAWYFVDLYIFTFMHVARTDTFPLGEHLCLGWIGQDFSRWFWINSDYNGSVFNTAFK